LNLALSAQASKKAAAVLNGPPIPGYAGGRESKHQSPDRKQPGVITLPSSLFLIFVLSLLGLGLLLEQAVEGSRDCRMVARVWVPSEILRGVPYEALQKIAAGLAYLPVVLFFLSFVAVPGVAAQEAFIFLFREFRNRVSNVLLLARSFVVSRSSHC
jgi:hypothetical protein